MRTICSMTVHDCVLLQPFASDNTKWKRFLFSFFFFFFALSVYRDGMLAVNDTSFCILKFIQVSVANFLFINLIAFHRCFFPIFITNFIVNRRGKCHCIDVWWYFCVTINDFFEISDNFCVRTNKNGSAIDTPTTIVVQHKLKQTSHVSIEKNVFFWWKIIEIKGVVLKISCMFLKL